MRKDLWKAPGRLYFLAFAILMAIITTGCAQNGGGDGQPSDEQTAGTEEGMTVEEVTVGEGETTQGRAQQRQSPREGQPSDQQDGQQTITVRITGTEGLSFAGRVGSAQELQRIQGSVPEEYEIPFEGAAVTAAVRKQEPGEGTLGVEVVRDGEVVASRETSTSTGVVNVIWTPREQGDG